MQTLTTAQAVVSMLEVNGIDTIFCLPGVQNDPFFDALYDRTNAIRPIHARHEQACAYMALGYAMASGKPSAYVVVPGPGFLNTTAALSTAYAVNAPVLALTGQIQQAMIGRNVGLLHELPDQLAIMRGLTKWADRIHAPAEAPGLIERSLPPPAVGPPPPGRAGMRHGHLGAQGAGRADLDAGRGRSLPGRRGCRRARGQASGRRAASADRGRRRRAGCGRACTGDRRDARRAGHDRAHGPGRDRRTAQALGHHAGRLPLLGRGRRRAGRRHAAAAAAAELGHGRCAEGDPHRRRQRGARSPAPARDRHRRRRDGDLEGPGRQARQAQRQAQRPRRAGGRDQGRGDQDRPRQARAADRLSRGHPQGAARGRHPGR